MRSDLRLREAAADWRLRIFLRRRFEPRRGRRRLREARASARQVAADRARGRVARGGGARRAAKGGRRAGSWFSRMQRRISANTRTTTAVWRRFPARTVQPPARPRPARRGTHRSSSFFARSMSERDLGLLEREEEPRTAERTSRSSLVGASGSESLSSSSSDDGSTYRFCGRWRSERRDAMLLFSSSTLRRRRRRRHGVREAEGERAGGRGGRRGAIRGICLDSAVGELGGRRRRRGERQSGGGPRGGVRPWRQLTLRVPEAWLERPVS